MVRIVLSILIAAHGIGHILFLVPMLGIADWNQATHFWWLSGDSGISRFVGGILFLIVIVGYCFAVYGLSYQLGWWRSAAIVASVLSSLGVIIFWMIPATSPALSALVFNLLVLGALLVVHYPGVETVGA